MITYKTYSFICLQIKPHKYVKECEAAKSIVVEALRLLCDLDWDDQRNTDPSNRMSRPRVPHELLFVIGGWSGGTPTNLVEVYDTKADSWVVSKHYDGGKQCTISGNVHLRCC